MIIVSNKNEINSNLINNEITFISSMLTSEKNLKKQLMFYMNKISTNINDMINPIDLDGIHSCLKNIKIIFEKLDANIKSLNSLINLLNEFKTDLTSIDEKILENYNVSFFKNFSDFLDVNDSTSSFILTLEPYVSISFPEEDVAIVEHYEVPVKPDDNKSSSNKSLRENTLIVSETQGKVILPYTLSELQKKQNINPEEDSSIEEIINKYYTIPLDFYKNSSFSRFREAFNLIKYKENGSFKEAIDLGLELFFNYNLNPAIITACKNLDELDIYLSCLDDNELNEFKCFDIIYEYAPTLTKPK